MRGAIKTYRLETHSSIQDVSERNVLPIMRNGKEPQSPAIGICMLLKGRFRRDSTVQVLTVKSSKVLKILLT